MTLIVAIMNSYCQFYVFFHSCSLLFPPTFNAALLSISRYCIIMCTSDFKITTYYILIKNTQNIDIFICKIKQFVFNNAVLVVYVL